MDGMDHTIQVKRLDITVSTEGQPSQDLVNVGAPFQGYLHEGSSTEESVAATLGSDTSGHCLIPYGVDVREQDRLQVTFADGRVALFRITGLRDNHIMSRADVVRDVS